MCHLAQLVIAALVAVKVGGQDCALPENVKVSCYETPIVGFNQPFDVNISGTCLQENDSFRFQVEDDCLIPNPTGGKTALVTPTPNKHMVGSDAGIPVPGVYWMCYTPVTLGQPQLVAYTPMVICGPLSYDSMVGTDSEMDVDGNDHLEVGWAGEPIILRFHGLCLLPGDRWRVVPNGTACESAQMAPEGVVEEPINGAIAEASYEIDLPLGRYSICYLTRNNWRVLAPDLEIRIPHTFSETPTATASLEGCPESGSPWWVFWLIISVTCCCMTSICLLLAFMMLRGQPQKTTGFPDYESDASSVVSETGSDRKAAHGASTNVVLVITPSTIASSSPWSVPTTPVSATASPHSTKGASTASRSINQSRPSRAGDSARPAESASSGESGTQKKRPLLPLGSSAKNPVRLASQSLARSTLTPAIPPSLISSKVELPLAGVRKDPAGSSRQKPAPSYY